MSSLEEAIQHVGEQLELTQNDPYALGVTVRIGDLREILAAAREHAERMKELRERKP